MNIFRGKNKCSSGLTWLASLSLFDLISSVLFSLVNGNCWWEIKRDMLDRSNLGLNSVVFHMLTKWCIVYPCYYCIYASVLLFNGMGTCSFSRVFVNWVAWFERFHLFVRSLQGFLFAGFAFRVVFIQQRFLLFCFSFRFFSLHGSIIERQEDAIMFIPDVGK